MPSGPGWPLVFVAGPSRSSRRRFGGWPLRVCLGVGPVKKLGEFPLNTTVGVLLFRLFRRPNVSSVFCEGDLSVHNLDFSKILF
jgi:hypothetical protein